MMSDKWTRRTLVSLFLFIAVCAFVAIVGRLRGEVTYTDPNPLISVFLLLGLLAGTVLAHVVPVLSMIMIAKDSPWAPLIALAVVLAEVGTLVLSFHIMFPYGCGR